MILIVIPIIIIVFFATRYGIKSNTTSVRIASYFGIFLSVTLMVFLAFALVIERLEN